MNVDDTIFKDLLQNTKPGVKLSIYQSTQPASSGHAVQEDSTRFKNALQAIRSSDLYEEAGLAETMHSLDELVHDSEFWKHRTLGLAVFADKDGYQTMPLGFDVTSAYFIGAQYQVSPLVLLQSLSSHYFILDINHTRPRVLEVKSLVCTEVAIDGMPGSFESITDNIEYTNELQHQSGGVIHGHSDESALKDNMLTYHRNISEAVDIYLSKHAEPLLLIGVQNRVGSLRQLLSYPHTLDDYIEGSGEAMNEQTLYDKSLPVIERYNSQQRHNAVHAFQETAPTLTAVGFEASQKAANEGRVARLLVPSFRQTTDTIQEGYEAMIVLQLSHDDTVTESLVRSVLSQGGDVVAVAQDSFKDEQSRAVCRF